MKLPLMTYEPSSFVTLNDFEPAKELLSKHRHLIETLGDTIRSFGLEKHLGVCLLHKHFNITPQEALVEAIDSESIRIAPRSISELNGTIPYMWRLVLNEQGDQKWVPLEFVELSSVTSTEASFVERLANEIEFFDQFSQLLLSLGVANIFGLAIHHRKKLDFDRSTHVLLENDSFEERYMWMRPVPRASAASPDWTQTLWRFPTVGQAEVESECDQHGCAGHCTNHTPSTGVF